MCARAASRPEASDTSAPPARPVVAMVFAHLYFGGMILGWILSMAPGKRNLKRPAAAGVRGGGADEDLEEVEDEDEEVEDEDQPPPPSGPRAPREQAPSDASDGVASGGAPSSAAGAAGGRLRRLQGAAAPSSAGSPVSAEAPTEAMEPADQRGVKREQSSPPARAPKGIKRDLVAANKMLASLRQTRDGNDPEKAKQAENTLAVYKNLGWDQKESMVTRFKSKSGRGSMKWIDEWTETRTKEDDTVLKWNENWHGPGKILSMLGYTLRDFDSREEAKDRVTKEVRRNQERFGTLESHPPKIDEEDWLSSEYFWTIDDGKTRTVAPPPPPSLPRSLARERGREGDPAGQDRGAGAGPHLQDDFGQAHREARVPGPEPPEGHQERWARSLPGRARGQRDQAGGGGQRSERSCHACLQSLEDQP